MKKYSKRVFAPKCVIIIIDVIPIYDTQPIANLMNKSINKLLKSLPPNLPIPNTLY